MARLRIFICVLFVYIGMLCFGQKLNFVYITNTEPEWKTSISEQVETFFIEAENGTPTILYLSDSETPKIALLGVNGEWNIETYNEIQAELQERSFHSTNATIDRDRIVSLFEDIQIPGSGEHKFHSLSLELVVSQTYWDWYKELIWGSVFFILDMGNLESSNLSIQLYYYGVEELEYDIDTPFGSLNLCPSITANIEKIQLK